jgi:DNA-binding transcriptional MerR regulator
MLSHFSTKTVAKLTGASVRKIDYWARTGLLRPSYRDAAGKGTKRLYTFQDVVALQTVCNLREGNCPLGKIRSAISYLTSNYPELSESQTLSRLTLLTDGKRVYVLTDHRQVMDVLTRQMVWSVPLGKIILETNARVEDLPQEWVEEETIEGESFHLLVSFDSETAIFSVQCRELPGALESGKTASQALAKARKAVRSVIAYSRRKKRSARPSRRIFAAK